MFALVLSILVIQKGCQPFHIAAGHVFTLLYEHQVYTRNSAVSFAYSVRNSMVLFPTKNIGCKIWILPSRVYQSVKPALESLFR